MPYERWPQSYSYSKNCICLVCGVKWTVKATTFVHQANTPYALDNPLKIRLFPSKRDSKSQIILIEK
jgi:hypothetical protein